MRVGLVQMDAGGVSGGDCGHFERYVREALAAGCGLVIFPELSDSGYGLSWRPERGENLVVPHLGRMARAYGIAIMAGLREAGDGKDRNTLQVFGRDGSRIARYDKMHLFRGQTNDETEHFDAGANPAVAVIGGVRVGLSICYDLRFPQLYRKYALGGADVLVTVAAWPLCRIADWRLLLQARALENQSYAMGVNYCGAKDGLVFGGHSMVCGPDGSILVEADVDSGTCLVCDIDAEQVAALRRIFPVLCSDRMG